MSHYATYIAKALATEGGHLQIGRGGFSLLAYTAGEVALRIQIDQQDAMIQLRQGRAQGQGDVGHPHLSAGRIRPHGQLRPEARRAGRDPRRTR